jgi:hypothetical protein
MHDLDRTMQELDYDQEYDGFEYDDEADNYGEYDEEYDDSEYDDEYDDGEYDDQGEYEYEYEYGDEEGDVLFTEEEEMELAADLLSVGSEEELDQFIGKMFRKAGRRLRRFGRGIKRVARKTGRVVKAIAKRALPIAGAVAGGIVGGPLGGKLGSAAGRAASRLAEYDGEADYYDQELAGIAKNLGKSALHQTGKHLGRKAGGKKGGKAGSHFARAATSLFELELEGLSPEDQEFEVARRVVRLAGSATQKAAKLGQHLPPDRAIRQGFKAAARRHAPGLLKPRRNPRMDAETPKGGKVQRSGKWVMRGNTIVVLGL